MRYAYRVIQRSSTSDFAAPTTYQAAANATTWSQTAPRARTFYFRIRADNLGGGSAWSNVVSLTTP
jgi:hypothetical protein